MENTRNKDATALVAIKNYVPVVLQATQSSVNLLAFSSEKRIVDQPCKAVFQVA